MLTTARTTVYYIIELDEAERFQARTPSGNWDWWIRYIVVYEDCFYLYGCIEFQCDGVIRLPYGFTDTDQVRTMPKCVINEIQRSRDSFDPEPELVGTEERE